nr:DNA internalization-related competence protein ComEC/Rec2 [Bacilli bacterium]
DTGGIESYYYEEWQEKNNSYSLGEDTICMYLKSDGIKKLDYLILTHGDYDHLGETLSILECIKVNNVIFNSGEVNANESNIINVLEDKNISYYFYKDKDVLNISNYELLFLNPSIIYDNENDNSLVIYLDINNYKFLFTGDISQSVEESIIDEYDLDIDILKVAHHGSKTSSSYEFLNNITPLYSIISVGVDNKFGHPSSITLNNLKKVNSKIYNTSIDGSVKFKIKNGKIKIITCSS